MSTKYLIILLILTISKISGFNEIEQKSIENYHNYIRIKAKLFGAEPKSPLNQVKWSNDIANKVQTFVSQCNLGVPQNIEGTGFALFKVMGKEFDPVDILNRTFERSAPLYDWSTGNCKPDQCCDTYQTMIWNTSTSVGCASSYCSSGSYNFFVCGYYPIGNFAGIKPYTPKVQSQLTENGSGGGDTKLEPSVKPISINVSSRFILPTSSTGDVDWKSLGFVTSIKNQGQCGGCYSFATCAALESAYLIKNNLPNTDIDLSEQNFVSCVNYGCGGGNGQSCLDKLKSTGIMYETSYPYKAVTGSCPNVIQSPQPFKWTGYSNIQGNKEAFLNALKSGPIYASLYVDSGFQLYKSGIYSCSQSSTPNHAITIVGYSSADNSYLIKNSWGTIYGESGYIRLKEGSCNLYSFTGITTQV
ncbi:hypothetical protein DDB_G0276111 [Dictyostelium discoideum AX4]|uniref:Uncharacterized protein n=1 Tax=Dictyostelium discoideum TaxID=44689 RepID=Q75JH0_DICDI|nr:hypothetical protein DDB_G0276111 [Dictyostelium discoideum AX4]EAL69355.1 hypothetical protein DDB_G0276111 [Dictyostelium discoideum AX4]|eukprot:XP_643261.1 hypothetical protein DDB_G0276111 [Dictyostelium discoideum AX4]